MLQVLIEPLTVLLVIFLIASPFSLSIHKLISFLRRNVGSLTTLAVYALEIAALLAWNTSYINDLDANIASGRYDEPVGFERGILSGFVIIFAATLVLQNGVGLLLLYRRVLWRAIVTMFSHDWRKQMIQIFSHSDPLCPSIAHRVELNQSRKVGRINVQHTSAKMSELAPTITDLVQTNTI